MKLDNLRRIVLSNKSLDLWCTDSNTRRLLCSSRVATGDMNIPRIAPEEDRPRLLRILDLSDVPHPSGVASTGSSVTDKLQLEKS